MPLRKCDNCHHEWETNEIDCDWCGSRTSTIILNETQFEVFARELFNVKKDT